MGQLLMNWLNDEVQLSKRITNFEQDFNNGYLFGQLLSKYSQQLNFYEFINKYDKDSKIKNYTLLYDTLCILRITFDSNIAMNIIKKKKGVALKVLYQLKMQLQKTTNNVFNKINKNNKSLSPLKRIPIPKDIFDRVSKEHFNKQLNQMHRAQKNINLQQHLHKYQVFQQKQFEKIKKEKKKQIDKKIFQQTKFRQKQMQNIKKLSQFRYDWQHSNLQKWATNMAIRTIQLQKDNIFKTKIQNIKIQNKTMSQLNAIKILDKDIKQFQKNILKKYQDDSDSDNQNKLLNQSDQYQNSGQFIKSGRIGGLQSRSNFTTTFQQSPTKLKKAPQQSQTHRHQRQKRRRKMIVQQGKKQHLIKIQRQQKYIISTLQQTSKQQKQIQYQIWRAWQNKLIITQNKNVYNQKLKQKQLLQNMNFKFKNQQLLKTFRQEHLLQIKNGMERQNKLKIHNLVQQRKITYNQCKKIILQLLSITQTLYCYGQQKNTQKIDQIYFNKLLNQFVQGVIDKKSIIDLQFKNYIYGKSQWNIQIKRDQGISCDPVQDNSIPNKIVNNYYLGNILKYIFKQIYEKGEQKHPKIVQSQNLIALLGLQHSFKKTIANKIKQQFGFNIIQISQLIKQKLQDYLNMKNNGIQIDGVTAELVQICYSGKDIPNSFIINLIKQHVLKYKKCLLVNYPTTYQQCIQFTKVFGGTEPADYASKSKLAQKVQEFSRLVWPTQTKMVPRTLKPCGLDFALWIDISPKTSLDRFIGRRWNAQGKCVHITDEIQNPNGLITGQRGYKVIVKNNYKLKNRSKLQNWLTQFGISVKQQDKTHIQKCWQMISGQCSLQQLTKKVTEVIRKALQIKQKKREQQKREQKEMQQKQQKNKVKQLYQLQLKQKCVLSTPQQIKQKYKMALQTVKIDSTFLLNIQIIWNNVQKLTINTLLNIFQVIRQQQQNKNRYISSIKKNYLIMITRQDQRFYLIKKYQNEYNNFIDKNNDMLTYQYTKQQLHERISDLQNDLLTLIQQKKQDAINQRDNIIKSGWYQNQLDQIISCIHLIIQIQLYRSFTSQQIINDFYNKKFMVNTAKIQDTQTQIPIDKDLDIIKDNGFPRLQKLITEATRIFNREQQVLDDKNKKGGKAPPPKKQQKKQAKKGGKDQSQEKIQQTAEDLEYKKAINTEKAIFRYRLKVIEGFAIKKIKVFQQQVLKLYADLQDLYKYTDKVQNRAVLQMTKIFRRCIEEQKKIENEVKIQYINIQQSKRIRNFKKPQPIILPAVQKTKKDRFTISAIRQMIALFEGESEAGITIKNNRLMALFEHLSVNQSYSVLLPQSWKSLSRVQHQKFISKFDKNGKGEIELWIIFMVITLSNYMLPTLEQIKEYELAITDHNPLQKQIQFSAIEKNKCWFDEQQPHEQNVRYFDRNRYIKQILFEVLKNKKTENIVVDKFISKISFVDFVKKDLGEDKIGYFQFAFYKE